MSTAPSVTRGHVSRNRSISIIAVEVVTGHIATKLFSKALVQNRCVLGLVGKLVVYTEYVCIWYNALGLFSPSHRSSIYRGMYPWDVQRMVRGFALGLDLAQSNSTKTAYLLLESHAARWWLQYLLPSSCLRFFRWAPAIAIAVTGPLLARSLVLYDKNTKL